jgi:hypothetical protein
VNGAETDVTSGIYLPRALLGWFDTSALSTRPGVAGHGRVMRCISFNAQLGRTWKCRTVACVYPRLVCGVIRTDL